MAKPYPGVKGGFCSGGALRCSRDEYRWPVEMLFTRWLMPESDSRERHPRVLLVNPTMTGKRHARFPLGDPEPRVWLWRAPCDQDARRQRRARFVARAVSAVRQETWTPLGDSDVGGPQLLAAVAVSKAVRAVPRHANHLGGAFPTNCPDATVESPVTSTMQCGRRAKISSGTSGCARASPARGGCGESQA